MKLKSSYSLKQVVLVLIYGIALACCIEKQVWYAVGLLGVHIGVFFIRMIDNPWMALKLWVCYLIHVVSGVYLMERAVIFIWVAATSVFLYDSYTELTGESILTLFGIPEHADNYDEW